MLRIFRIISIVLLALAWSGANVTSFGQDEEPIIIFHGKVSDLAGKKLAGATVEIVQDGKVIHSLSSASNGKYEQVEVPWGHMYTIRFKKGGWVSKEVSLDTDKGYFPEDVEPFTELEVSMSMFQEQNDVNYDIVTSKPVGKARIDPGSGFLEWDGTFTSQRRKEIDKFLKGLIEKANEAEAEFLRLVEEGDKAVGGENYDAGIAKYEEALKLKEDDMVREKIIAAKAKKKEAEEAKKADEAFNAKIAEGDALVADNKFDDAIAKYEEAKSLKPGDKLPATKIKEAQAKQSEIEAAIQREKYQEMLDQANKAFEAKDYENARPLYESALEILPSESFPRERIAEIDLLKKQAAENEQKYADLLVKGDQALSSDDFDNAIKAYEEALTIKKEESYPKEKIEEAKKKKEEAAQANAQEKQYQDAIKKADDLFGKGTWPEAIAAYQEASGIKPDESYPKEKIAEAESKIKEEADKKAEAEAKEAEYQAAKDAANQLFADGKLEEAKAAYNELLTIKADDTDVKAKLKEIAGKEKEAADASAAEEKKFEDLMKAGDAALGKGDLEEAKAKFNEAQGVFPERDEPKVKLEEVVAKEQEIANAAEAEAQKQSEYEALMASGQEKIDGGDLNGAKADFESASALFSDKSEPKDKIKEVDSLLGEKAKSDEKEAEYQGVISQADAAKADKKWDEAKKLYKKAHELKPEDSYAQEQIDAINGEMEAETQAERDKQYEKIISVADQKLGEGDMKKAKELYERALKMNPEDDYPGQKIAQIDNEIARLAKIENDYQTAIQRGDKQFKNEDWDQAKVSYEEALRIKVGEEYPTNQLALIQENKNKDATADVKDHEEEKKYEELIEKGDDEFEKKEFEEAKETFTEASEIKPDAQYPKNKIEEIDVEVEKQKQAEALENQYKELISQADGKRDSKSWDEAKKLYKDAFAIKSEETYPQEQIDWINEQMKAEREADLAAQIQKIIDKADELFDSEKYKDSKGLFERAVKLDNDNLYAKKRIKEIEVLMKQQDDDSSLSPEEKAKLEKYNKLIEEADKARDQENWMGAKEKYKQAHGVDPVQSYPQEQIDWINKRMKEISMEEAKKQYQKILQAANNKYAVEEYDKAIALYERAISMNPDDPFPPAQIAKLRAKMNEKDEVNMDDAEYERLVKEGDGNFDSESWKAALGKYKGALKLKPEESYPQQKIDEIMAKLDELAVKKVEKKVEKPPVDNSSSDYLADLRKNPYGEEVTGKYKEYDVKNLLAKVKLDEDDYKYEIIRDKKDLLANEFDEENKIEENRSTENRSNLEEMRTRITDETIEADKNRQNLIPEVQGYQDGQEEFKVNLDEYGSDVTYEVDQQYEENETKSRLEFDEKDMPRTKLIPIIDEYKEVQSDQLTDVKQTNIDNSDANNEEYNRREGVEENFHEGMDKPRQAVVPVVDLYKDGVSSEIDRNYDINKERVTDNYQDAESLETRRTKAENERDRPRQDMVPEVERFFLEVEKNQRKDAGENTERTYSNFDSYEDMEDNLEDFSEKADVPRQNVLHDVDHYQDKNSAIYDVLAAVDADKTYNVYEENEILAEEMTLDSDKGQAHIEKNAATYEGYSDRVDDLNDQMSNQSIDRLDTRSDEMDAVKELSPTRFSDANREEIARMYPEGVTEKMFQRKNSRGDVIEVTILRFVVSGNKGDEYKKVVSKWGEYYFKNGGVISEYIWDTETN